jgi:hypothetical protein
MPQLITLIPNSGVHFWDIDLDMEQLPRLSPSLWEEPVKDGQNCGDIGAVVLRELSSNKTGMLSVKITGVAPDPGRTDTIGRNQTLGMRLNKVDRTIAIVSTMEENVQDIGSSPIDIAQNAVLGEILHRLGSVVA